jgi:TM2 domain-containing membrane protein YozV
MMRSIIFIVIFLMAGVITPAMAFYAQNEFVAISSGMSGADSDFFSGDSLSGNGLAASDVQQISENRRAVAIILNITLGMLGVHRLYLGTKPWVPAVYLFTFGGGFFMLPFVDLVFLIANKDISRFENNPRVLMWLSDKVINQEGN